MKKAKVLLGISVGLLLIFSAGCQEVPGDQLGNLVVKITDAPFPIDLIEEATVKITKVEIRIESEGEEEEYPFITLFEGEMEFNLLDLRNGITAELLDIDIPAGNYNLIRLFVDHANMLVKDGENYEVKVPSGA